jgi:hypothetical protein
VHAFIHSCRSVLVLHGHAFFTAANVSSAQLYILARPLPHLHQLASDIGELALVQLGIPEDGVCVVEAVLDPSVLLDVVQVDETTRVCVTVGGSQNTPLSELQRLVVLKIVLVLGIEHTVGECLTGADTEQVAGKASTVAVDVVERRAFLRRHTRAHGTLKSIVRGTSGRYEVRLLTMLKPMPL